ncbi:hypothetical protein ACIP93_11805 [Streptomyces sp. NPDC088745]|uniref:hypothetical protein n=1 Tax=Streptomyces sp. NPDC088745 TaxID=3365884 RepID=UPI003826FA4B
MPSTARAWLAALTAEYGTEGTLHLPHEPAAFPAPKGGEEDEEDTEQPTISAELSARVAEYNRQRRMFGGR